MTQKRANVPSCHLECLHAATKARSDTASYAIANVLTIYYIIIYIINYIIINNIYNLIASNNLTTSKTQKSLRRCVAACLRVRMKWHDGTLARWHDIVYKQTTARDKREYCNLID